MFSNEFKYKRKHSIAEACHPSSAVISTVRCLAYHYGVLPGFKSQEDDFCIGRLVYCTSSYFFFIKFCDRNWE